MKNRRAILALLVVAVALAAAELLLSARAGRQAKPGSDVLVADADAAVRIAVERRDKPALVLERDVEWRITSPFSAEADSAAVIRMLDALALSHVEESAPDAELLRNGQTRASYALDQPPLRISLSWPDDRKASVSLGTLTASGGGVYVATDDSRSVMIVPSSVLAAIDVPVERLRRRSLFRSAADAVAAFDVRQRSGAVLAFSRSGDGWSVGTCRASAARVTKFLNELLSAEAGAFVWPTGATNESAQVTASLLSGYGLDSESAVTVTVKGVGGRSEAVSFGKRADDNAVYAFVHGAGPVVTVDAAVADAAEKDAGFFADARVFSVQADKVASLAMSDGQLRVSLARDERGEWRLVSPVSAPADQSAADALLARVLAMTTADIADAGVQVSVGDDAKPVVVPRKTLFPDGGGFERLRAGEIVDLRSEEIRRVVSTPAGKDPVAVVFSGDRKAWSVEKAPDGAAASEGGVAKVVAALSPLKASRVVRLKVLASELADYGLDAPSLQISVDLAREDAVRRNVLVGARAEDGVYATVGAADAVFVISYETLKALSSPLVEGTGPK